VNKKWRVEITHDKVGGAFQATLDGQGTCDTTSFELRSSRHYQLSEGLRQVARTASWPELQCACLVPGAFLILPPAMAAASRRRRAAATEPPRTLSGATDDDFNEYFWSVVPLPSLAPNSRL